MLLNISFIIACSNRDHEKASLTEYLFDSLGAQLIGKMSVLIKDYTLSINDNDRCSNVYINLMQMSLHKRKLNIL